MHLEQSPIVLDFHCSRKHVKIDLVNYSSLNFPLILLICFGFLLSQITLIEFNCFRFGWEHLEFIFLGKSTSTKYSTISNVISERKISEGQFEALVVYQFVIMRLGNCVALEM